MIVRVGDSPLALKPVEDFVQQTFPGSVLKEKHHNTLQYQLPYTQGALAAIFSQFTSHQQSLALEDYSVSQTTLDQVRSIQIVSVSHFYNLLIYCFIVMSCELLKAHLEWIFRFRFWKPWHFLNTLCHTTNTVPRTVADHEILTKNVIICPRSTLSQMNKMTNIIHPLLRL